MKKLLSTLVLLLFAVLCNVNAQHKSLSSGSNEFKYDATGNAMNVADVNTKALKDFNKSFKNVTSEKWSWFQTVFLPALVITELKQK